ncbi:MAG: HAMP domain-containing sensor histidine kinase [Spirochaetales bacterium]
MATWLSRKGTDSRTNRDYYLRTLPERWNTVAATFAVLLIAELFYLAYDWRLFPESTRGQGLGLATVVNHLAQLGGAALLLLLFFLRKRLQLTPSSQEWILRVALVFFLLSCTAHSMLNQLVEGRSIALFHVGIITAALVFYEPPRVILPLFGVCGALLLAAIVLWQKNADLARVDETNIVAVLLAGTLLYLTYHRGRVRLYRHVLELASCSKFKDAVIRASSHDLRAPISQIRVLLEQLEEPEETFLRQRSEIRQQLDQLFRRASLVLDNLLAIGASGREELPFQRQILSLDDLVEPLQKSLAAEAAGKAVTLEFRLPTEVLLVGDPAMLQSVLANLLANAIKYSQPGKRVTLDAEVQPTDVRVSVTDQGAGMEPEVLRWVNNGQAQPPRRGTAGEFGLGIGLSVCQTLLAFHESTLNFESQPGEGTRVWFLLPRFLHGFAHD